MKALALYQQYFRSTFAVLACLCTVSVFLYGVFLLEAVGHTANRARAGRAGTEIKAQLSVLEGRYLTATQALTPARATALGFVAPKAVATVYATDASRMLTLTTGDISAAAR